MQGYDLSPYRAFGADIGLAAAVRESISFFSSSWSFEIDANLLLRQSS
jgi:hypothetical protein